MGFGQLERIQRRVDDAYVRAPCFGLHQRAIFTGHAHRVAEGTENHVRMAGDFQTAINTAHRQYAYRATRAMNKLNILGQQLIETKLEDGMGMAATHFHNA